MSELLTIVFSGILGLLIGSFLNVVIYRVPRRLSVVSPPSACPKCGTQLKPWDNVPVFSWLLLRARCRYCGSRISGRYPLIEALTAVLFALAAALVIAQVSGPLMITISLVVAFTILAAVIAASGIAFDRAHAK